MSVVGTSPPPLHIKRAIRDSYHPATKGVVWDDVNVTVGNSVWGNVEDAVWNAVNGAAVGVGRAVNGAVSNTLHESIWRHLSLDPA